MFEERAPRPQRTMAAGLWSRTGAGAVVGGGAQLYVDAWTGDRHEGTGQGDMGCERSSRWSPSRQPLALELFLRTSVPLRPRYSGVRRGNRTCQMFLLLGFLGWVRVLF